MTEFANLLLALLPVVAFLALGVVMDGYKLVGLRWVVRSMAIGVVSALLALGVYLLYARVAGNEATAREIAEQRGFYIRYLGPVVEELLKGAFLVYLVRRGRVGFLVDAAIHGFAVGTGFALAENVYYYFAALEDAPVAVWVIRGFGTAVLHGSTTAMAGILGKALADRRNRAGVAELGPGLLLAVAMHSVYNHFLVHPLVATLFLIVAFPLLLIVVFTQSEKATRSWLGAGFDTDAELLELILSGEFTDTRVGRYLSSLRSRFPGPVLADMLCLLQVTLELSMRAKGMLLAREAGLDVKVSEDVRANLRELSHLEKSVGKAGLLALKPILPRNRRDLWQIYMLRRQ